VLGARLGAAPILLSLLRLRAFRRSALGFGGCFTDPAFVDGEFRDRVLRRSFGSREAAARQVEFLRNADFALVDRLRETHARIAAPVLLVWGTDDPFFPLARARAMLEQFAGGAELVEIPGGKLFAHEDHPEAFARHASRFLARAASVASDGQRARA
jgi:pimeloyl-ACP methyl ester carboxylesterase